MAISDRLLHAADALGYADSPGFVVGSDGEPGARDFVWRDLRSKCGVDAAFFHGAIPLVAFVEAESPARVKAVQRRLWNFGRVPLLIATTPEGASALSCNLSPDLAGPKRTPLLKSMNEGQSVADVLAEFSRSAVETGQLADRFPDRFSANLRVDRRLLENLRVLRRKMIAAGCGPRTVEQLLGRSIFVRYLEDRSILTPDHFNDLVPFTSYEQVLNAGPDAVRTLFLELGRHFSGDSFTAFSDPDELGPEVLELVSDFFSGANLSTGQGSLFPYDFAVIPPELVSSIYEQLLEANQRQDAAYYTPRGLVDLVLDELLPWDDSGDVTVLDPACGSGIFLTEAFRRLAYRRTVVDGQPAEFQSLSDLLTASVFGVDKNEAAIGVTAFGLQLALLEHVDPRTAWREARLPSLIGTNLIVSDFFGDHPLAGEVFDVIAGNPPWKSQLSVDARRYVARSEVLLADKQIALAFMSRTAEMTAPEGVSGLVMPAKPLLHNRSGPSEAARLALFESIGVDLIVDLSPIRRHVFGASSSPAAVVFSRGLQPTDPELTDAIVYMSPRATRLAEAIDGYVISQTDVHRIPARLAASVPDVWKPHLWGSPADFEFTRRLSMRFTSLESVARERNWYVGNGFQVAGGEQNDSSHLVGRRIIPAESVRALRIEMPAEVPRVVDQVMHYPRDPRLFSGPRVLMRKGFSGEPVAAFTNGRSTFPEGLSAVVGRRNDTDDLRVIAGILNSSLAHYYLFMTASSWGVEREQIMLKEYLSVPVPALDETFRRAMVEVVSAAENGTLTHDEWKPQLDTAVFEAFGLTDAEADLVRDGISFPLDEFKHGATSQAFASPASQEVQAYRGVASSVLGALLPSVVSVCEVAEGPRGFLVLRVAFIDAGGTLTDGPEFGEINEILTPDPANLAPWSSPGVVLQPTAVLVMGNAVFVVKPNERRHWSRSAARRDAAAVVEALLTVDSRRDHL